jgi:uncharacterized SAM-binding protein YcdF (DUF218 family)
MSAILGAVAGFFGALVALGVPLGKFLYDTRQDAHKAVRLLTGEEETEDDGVIPRLRTVEQIAQEHRRAIERAGEIEIADRSERES